MSVSFFDFLNSINDTKKDLLQEDPNNISGYVPFMVNRGLSYFPDTLMFANEMNQHAGVEKRWQYDFYRHGVAKKKRFSKWHKKDQYTDELKVVMKEYDYSAEKAAQAISLLSEDKLKNLMEKYTTGGK